MGGDIWLHSVKTMLSQISGLNLPEEGIILYTVPQVCIFDNIDNGRFFSNSYS